jgi:putative transcriptional regulator
VVFQGGPVALDSALGLATVPGGAEPLGWRRVHGGVGLVDLDAPPEVLAAELGSLRIFAGYAGWGPGQLEAELAAGAWFVVDSEPGDAFSPEPEGLWRSVLRRQRGSLALVATYPEDPALN